MKEALESCDGRGPRLRERGEVKEVMRRLMGRSVRSCVFTTAVLSGAWTS
jgi:hypothetical protein